jgi:peptidoglycan/LPS O-acetylase OafA/YrhL
MSRGALVHFWMRRGARLLPALVVAALLACLLAWHDGTHFASRTLPGLPYVAFYSGNWLRVSQGLDALGYLGHTWSLAVEEQFYVMWPLLLWLTAALTRRRGLLVAVAIVGCIASVWLRLSYWHGPHSYARVVYGSDTVADQLLYGCLLASVLNFGRGRVLRSWFRRAAAAGAWLGIALFIWFCMTVSARPTSPHARLIYTWGYVAIALIACVTIAHLWWEPRSALSGVFAWRPVAYVGRISYGIYLFHFPISESVRRHYAGALAPVLVMALSTGLAAISFTLLEVPVRRWIRVWSKPSRPLAGPSLVLAGKHQ